jgi:hypothetical protein
LEQFELDDPGSPPPPSRMWTDFDVRCNDQAASAVPLPFN